MDRWKKIIVLMMFAVIIAQPVVAEWNPSKPITIVVPYGAGGVTDHIIRVVSQELASALGQNIVVVNQPGASGSVGTHSVMTAPHDGYTWLSGGVRDLGTYAVVGMLDTKFEDWHHFVAATISGVLSVNPSTPYKSVDDFIVALKKDSSKVLVATAGINSTGGQAIGELAASAGVKVEQIVYGGGKPAVLAVVKGEAQATTQSSLNQSEMLRAGRLRPLAVFSSAPMILEGISEIPPITKWYPEIAPTENFVGIYIPKGVPDEVIQTLDKVWVKTLENSEALNSLCATKGCVVNVLSMDKALKESMPLVQAAAWGLYERKEHKVSPADLGIPPIKK